MNRRLFLVHWQRDEAEARAEALGAFGWSVDVEAEDGARAVVNVLANPPAAVVISLGRLPSHGRETARGLHGSKRGRSIPILFLDGNEPAIEKARAAVPLATFATSDDLAAALDRICADARGVPSP